MEIRNHEYYVSLEVAKLLKKAGFDWEICDGYIIYEDDSGFTTELQTPHNFNGDNGDLFIDYRGHKEVLSRPTLSVAQRWLRDVKNEIVLVDATGPKFYSVSILGRDSTNKNFNTYEKALEAGIKKALELILKKKIICQQEKDC